MVIAALMAGGSGSRMGCTDVPKQFITLADAPILVHTVRRFLDCPEVDKTVIMSPAQWVPFTKELLEKYFPDSSGKLYVTEGGKTRNETLERSVEFIREKFSPARDSVILTHDAVRPFVTRRMITENIAAAEEYGACNTVVPATDTITVSRDGRFIDDTPDRSLLFHSQTPQSFRLGDYSEIISGLPREEREKMTDACMVFTSAKKRVFMVRGEQTNIKITYPGDLAVAEAILKGFEY